MVGEEILVNQSILSIKWGRPLGQSQQRKHYTTNTNLCVWLPRARARGAPPNERATPSPGPHGRASRTACTTARISSSDCRESGGSPR